MRLHATSTFQFSRTLPEGLRDLNDIAYNLRWTWSTDAVALFQRIDQGLWQATGHNPVRLLQRVAAERLDELAEDEGFRAHLTRVAGDLRGYLARPAQLDLPGTSEESVVAYFSMEFALTESLPSYSGGLGVLAGDHLKSASDLGLQLVGVGIFYHEGYFQQALDPDGWQRETYNAIDAAEQPLHRLRTATGEALNVHITIEGRVVVVAGWRMDVGGQPLYLLDTNLEENDPGDRAISGRLYGGDVEMRIKQEILLGIGGVRLLKALNLRAVVCHMNEGHSAMLGVERIRMLMEETSVSFDEARLPVSAATVFTTHTAVAAGIDLFPTELVTKHLRPYYAAMGLDDEAFLGLGRIDAADEEEPFSMALLGLRLSGYQNGVSQLHRAVARQLWSAAWPSLPIEEIPIDGVINGVHLPTWVSHEMGELYDRTVGTAWRDEPSRAHSWEPIANVEDQDLWRTHERQRALLVARARLQYIERNAQLGLAVSHSQGLPLDPAALTIGFARRFAGYKRATLLFRDLDRLAAIVNQPGRPVQFLFAGKAHPRDEPAKALIRDVVEHSRRPELRDRLVVLERYDVEQARALVQGCDAWLNTPLRPLEASGTSGMKAVANGGLHLSVLDGWWAEAYAPGNGWAIGGTRAVEDPEVQDAFDAASLYDLLENEVAPLFYERDADGVPTGWVRMMKDSIRTFAPIFNTNRMVADYAERAYGPAAQSWLRLRENDMKPARELAAWLALVRESWDSMADCDLSDDLSDRSAESPVTVQLRIKPGDLRPSDVQFVIVHGRVNAVGEMRPGGEAPMELEGSDGAECLYRGQFWPVGGGRMGYKIRATPSHPLLRDPLATGLVRWL